MSIWKKAGAKASRFAYEKKIATGKNSPQNLKQAGITAYKCGDLTLAKRRLDEALKAGADDVNLWKTRAFVYEALRSKILHDVTKFIDITAYALVAYRSFEKSLQFIENFTKPDFLLRSGIACEAVGKWQQAIVCYSNIFINFPQYPRTNVVAMRAACIMAQNGEVGQAIGYVEMVLQSPPDQYKELDIIFILGRLYELGGRRQEANDSYREIHRQYKKQNGKKSNNNKKNSRYMGNKNGEKNHVNGKNNVDNNTIILDNGNLINVPTWKAWYRHPRIWYEWGKHLASIDCPIFAADALSESLKRGLVEMLDVNDVEPYILLARMAIWNSNKESAISSLEAGLNKYQYDVTLRAILLELRDDPWKSVFGKQGSAAISIQSLFRGFLARKQFFHVKQEANKLKRGAISLQKIWRGRKGRETFQHVLERTNAAECIQRSYRIHNSINILERKRMHRNAARLIQRMVRRWRWRCINATIIETICRAYLAKCKVQYIREREYCAVVIQSTWRSYKLRKVAKEMKRRRDASVVIQKYYRAYRCKKFFKMEKRKYWGAVGFQKIFRAYVAKMFVRKIQGVYATLLQKAYRGHRDRLRVHYMKHFPTSMETPIVRLMRIAAIQPGCTWLASRSMANKQYLHDAFEGDIIVSETNSIGSKEAKLIASLLFTNKTVKMLILKNGNIDDDGFTSLINAFTFNNCMETFAFGPNNITSKGMEALGSALKDHNLKIKNLILEGNPLDNTASKLLGGAIGDFFYRNYGQLEVLNVCNASLTDRTGMYFANSLYMNHSLQRMDLSNNFLGNNVAEQIAISLKANSVLLELNLCNNCISYHGGMKLAVAMQSNDTLRILNLESNLIQDDAAEMLLRVFQKRNSIRALRLMGNPTGHAILDAIEAIGIFRSSNDIEIISNAISPLPNLLVKPMDAKKHKYMKHGFVGNRKQRKTSKISGGSLPSPLVLSPYLIDQNIYHEEQKMKQSSPVKNKEIYHMLPEEWNYRIVPKGSMTKLSPSIKRPLPTIAPGPKRIKAPIRPGIPHMFPVLARPPSMAIPTRRSFGV